MVNQFIRLVSENCAPAYKVKNDDRAKLNRLLITHSTYNIPLTVVISSFFHKLSPSGVVYRAEIGPKRVYFPKLEFELSVIENEIRKECEPFQVDVVFEYVELD